jgi:hypothetical protein
MGVSALKLPRFSDQELAAEIRATDPTTDLDVNKIYLW